MRHLLLTTTTLPAHEGDAAPRFVLDLAIALRPYFSRVSILTPRHTTDMAPRVIAGVTVYNYAYAPHKLESLAHRGGIPDQLRQHKWKYLLAVSLLLGQLLALRRLRKREGVDHVLASWLIPQGIAAWLSGIPFSLWVLGGDIFTLKGQPFRWFKRRTAQASHCCLSVSSHTQRAVLAQTGRQSMVLPTGVNYRVFAQPVPVPAELQKLPQPITLFVGRFAEKKGVRTLFQSWKERPWEGSLVFIGDGPDRATLEEENAGLSRPAHFLGARNHQELPAYLQASQIFVCPSVQAANGDCEGRPTVLVEAAAAGCALVGTTVGGITEMLKDNQCGLLVPPNNAYALADACHKLAHNPQLRSALSAKAQGFAASQDWQALGALAASQLLDGKPT